MEKKLIKPASTQNDVRWIDGWPIIMKGISGFNSCLTVSTTSAIFIWSIHISVSTGIATWPGIMTALIMLSGPIIITWNFVNAKGIITTILPQQTEGHNSADGDEGSLKEQVIEIPKPIAIVTAEDIAIERELMGHTSVMLRALAGFISTHVICFCSLLFTITIHGSMVSGKVLPTNGELLLVVIGPVVTSWNFVRAGATLSSVMQSASNFHVFREKLAGVIKPK